MTRRQALRLVSYLNRAGARSGCRAEVSGDRVVFEGRTGRHSVAYLEVHGGLPRVLAHWRGFCENNGRRPGARAPGYVAWINRRGELTVGVLRRTYVSRNDLETYWGVSRVCADGAICRTETHRLSLEDAGNLSL